MMIKKLLLITVILFIPISIISRDEIRADDKPVISESKVKSKKKFTKQERFINRISARIDRLGITDLPKEIIIAQACLESGYGRVCPGYNLFGMTGRGSAGSIRRKDSDWVNGKRVSKWKRFRAYHNYDESVFDLLYWYYDKGWFNKLVDNNKNTVDNVLWHLDRSSYTTDPNYISKLKSIIRRYKL